MATEANLPMTTHLFWRRSSCWCSTEKSGLIVNLYCEIGKRKSRSEHWALMAG